MVFTIKLDSVQPFLNHPPVNFLPRHLSRCLLFSLAFAAAARAAEVPAKPLAELSARDAVALGLVEGVTEFLPISSTGHLIIVNQLLGLESDKQLTDKSGQPLWHKPPTKENPAGVPLTVKLAADTYTVVIQVGAIAAVLLLYWRQVLAMFIGLLGRSSSGFRLLRNVLLAFFPVAIVGLLLHDFIDRKLFSVPVVIAAQVVGAFLMLWAERWRRANSGIGFSKGDPSELTPPKALGIGFSQCLALWPGMSRSMMTIVPGYLAGLTPAKAAEFSFLVGLPVLFGAAAYKGLRSGPAMVEVFGWGNVLLGCLVAAISALIAVKFLVHFISRRGLAPFAYYRLALAVALLLFYLF
ncbi:MAG: uppP [Lacunisphaera sp.]|nr:uppP [Lacunisphaera sp.]MDB6164958.1 uppP [Lacunisphaera sp.]